MGDNSNFVTLTFSSESSPSRSKIQTLFNKSLLSCDFFTYTFNIQVYLLFNVHMECISETNMGFTIILVWYGVCYDRFHYGYTTLSSIELGKSSKASKL